MSAGRDDDGPLLPVVGIGAADGGLFRDPGAWRAIDELIIAPLIAGWDQEGAGPVRVWVPGCGTGEDAYAIAMLLAERAEAAGKPCHARIFATDVSEERIAGARRAVYPAGAVAGIPPERVRRFFDRRDEGDGCDGGVYAVKSRIREAVTVAAHNLLTDPPFTKLDLICCRGLLVRLKSEVQRRVLALLHGCLREGGHLVLGDAETVGPRRRGADLFEVVSHEWRIHRRREPATAGGSGPTRAVGTFPIIGAGGWPVTPATAPRPRSDPGELLRRALAERYAPASVLVDARGRALYFHGPTDRYLLTPSGEPTTELAALLPGRPGLMLRAALRWAAGKRRPTTFRTAALAGRRRGAGGPRHVAVTVAPLDDGGDAAGVGSGAGEPPLLLVTFEEAAPVPAAAAPPGAAPPTGEPDEAVEVELELERIRAELQGTVERLQASNEELTTAMEELAAVNEELEAAKEELSSANEELAAVNGELRAKVVELERTAADLANLIESTGVATLCLDPELRIRWFTPSMAPLLDLIPADVGRPLRQLAPKLDGGHPLLRDAEAVLAGAAPIGRDVTDGGGRWYARRVQPYRTAAGGAGPIGGVVVTLDDITARKARERRRSFLKEMEALALRTLEHPIEVLQAMTRAAAERFDVDRAAYAELDERQECAVTLQDFCRGVVSTIGTTRLAAFGPDAAAALRRGEPLVLGDVLADPAAAGARHFYAAIEARAVLCVPLVRDGRLEALFALHDRAPRAWSAEEVELAQLAAESAWLRTERARAERARDEVRAYAEAIVETVREPLVVLDGGLCVHAANRAFYSTFRVAPEATLGRRLDELGGGLWAVPALRRALRNAVAGGERGGGAPAAAATAAAREAEVEHAFEDGDRRTLRFTALPLQRRRAAGGGPRGGGRLVLLTVEDVTERRRAERRREALLREMQHRIKNNLSAVQALVFRTLRHHGGSPEAFWDAFEARLTAMARAQGLLDRREGRTIRLHDLVLEQLAPYPAAEVGGNVYLVGDEVLLPSRQAMALSMAVHELVSNAAKYGALADPDRARIEATWRIVDTADGGARLLFRWAEILEGPPPPQPSRQGFGHELIERVVRHELDGEARLEFRPEGVRCIVDAPLPGGGDHRRRRGGGTGDSLHRVDPTAP